MSNIKVSVIIPAFNASKYIRACLDSILASTLKDLEIIVVDDGSTDETSAILDIYVREKGIVAIKQTNGGPSKARNTGLECVKGEYVGFVDSDDWIENSMLEIMYNAAKKECADIVWCNIFKNENGKMTKYLASGSYGREEIEKDFFPRLICNTDYRNSHQTLRGSVCCRLYRRQLLQDNQIQFCEKINNNEDLLFNLKATIHAKCYVYLGDDYLYHNRVHGNSLTRKYIPHMWERQQSLIDELHQVNDNCSYDFSEQIAYMVFNIAEYSIFFDAGEGSPLSCNEQIGHIKEICSSKRLQDSLAIIKDDHLKPLRRCMYWCFRLRFCRILQWLVLFRQSRRDKGVSPNV